jgi:hypothetical protein
MTGGRLATPLESRRKTDMEDIHGTYKVDARATAGLQAGWFTEKFEMKPGYEDAVREFWENNREAYEAISLVVDQNFLVLKSDEGQDSFPILQWNEKADGIHMILDWDGMAEDLRVVRTQDGATLFLSEAGNSLSEIGWRKA